MDAFTPDVRELIVFCRTDEAGRKRYFDLDAVREPYQESTLKQHKNGPTDNGPGHQHHDGTKFERAVLTNAGAPPLDWWEIPTHPYKGAHYATWPPDLCVKPIKAMSPEKVCVTCGEASRRVATPSASTSTTATSSLRGTESGPCS